MKKIGLFLVFSLTLLATACGEKSNTLSCKLNSVNEEINLTIEFNNEGTKIEKYKEDTKVSLDNRYSKEDLDVFINLAKTACEQSGNLNCEVRVVDDKIVSSSLKNLNDLINGSNISIDRLKEMLEKDGYSCKK